MRKVLMLVLVLAVLAISVSAFAFDACLWKCPAAPATVGLKAGAAIVPDIMIFPAELSQYTDYAFRRKSDGGPGWSLGTNKVLGSFLKNVIAVNFTYLNQIANNQVSIYGPSATIDFLALLDNYILTTPIQTGNLQFQLGPGVLPDIGNHWHPVYDVNFKINLTL